MPPNRAAEAIDAVWRIESARLIAGLARLVGDVGIAEDLAQDALVVALEQWPKTGVPDNPGAWLMATAKHRAIDLLRRRKMQDRKHEHVARELEARQVNPEPDLAAAIDDAVAPPAGRTDDGRNRARVSRAEGNDSATHRARQADARGGARALCSAASTRACGAARLGARGHLPDLQ